MDFLLPIAAKSFLVAGAALLLLHLARKRSAAQRSWIAHLGLAAILLLPVAAVALPSLEVEAPGFLVAPVDQPAAKPVGITAMKSEAKTAEPATEVPVGTANFPESADSAILAGVDWGFWAYAAPAALLLLLTLIALGRLVALRARANVLVQPQWLSALAHAQRRMGFKHGTALLTSDDLPSPISWGVVRPVILLNSEATRSHKEAEAIIAHELAHVASFDWAKLLLSRITVALFWFNPLVWVLAREAHQLREEAADDSVLAADIPDTDYAQLLVGIARHECRGLLLGAHGVAPAKGSLARRVARVLDPASARSPAARPFALGVFVGAAALAAPLAALTLSPAGTPADALSDKQLAAASGSSYYPGNAGARAIDPAVEGAVRSAVGSALAVAHPHVTDEDRRELEMEIEKAIEAAWDGRGPRPGTTFGPQGRVGPDSAVERAVALKAVGASPEYIRSLRAVAPKLGRIDEDDMVALKAVGVTPDYIRELASAGFPNLNADDVMQARALGIRGSYIKGMVAAGFSHLTMDELVEMKAVGVTPGDVHRLRSAGYGRLTPDQVVQFKAVDSDHDEDGDHDPPEDDAGH